MQNKDVIEDIEKNIVYDKNYKKLIDLKKKLSSGKLNISFTGGFNVGKSTLINRLLNHNILPTKSIPTTPFGIYLHYNETISIDCLLRLHGQDKWQTNSTSIKTLEDVSQYLLHLFENFKNNLIGIKISLPCNILKAISIIDTPGLDTVKTEHITLLYETLFYGDYFFYLFDANRPLKENDYEFIKTILDYSGYIVFVINKTDMLDTSEMKPEEIKEYVKKTLTEKIKAKNIEVIQSDAFDGYHNVIDKLAQISKYKDKIMENVFEIKINYIIKDEIKTINSYLTKENEIINSLYRQFNLKEYVNFNLLDKYKSLMKQNLDNDSINKLNRIEKKLNRMSAAIDNLRKLLFK